MQMMDFNAIDKPTWPLKLKDDEQTVVHLSYPTLEMVERLEAMTPALNKAAKTKDGNTIRAVFTFLAEVMSCNDDGFIFTAEELRDKYRMTLLDAFRFVAGYSDFLKEANDAKN